MIYTKIMYVAIDTDCPPVMDYITSDFLPIDHRDPATSLLDRGIMILAIGMLDFLNEGNGSNHTVY